MIRYFCEITNRFAALNHEETDQWDRFKQEITAAAENTIGNARPTPKNPWVSNATLEIIEQRRAARLAGDMAEYRRLNRVRNAALRRDKEAYWANMADQLEEASRSHNQQKVYSLLRKAKAGQQLKTHHIKDANGTVLTTETEALNRWREHFYHLLNHPPIPTDPDLLEEANNNHLTNQQCSIDPVTEAEVHAALKKLRNSKAPGVCGITAEMLKYGGNTIIRWMTIIINFVWVLEVLPEDWTRGIILPFWKQKGEKLDCSNYRGITLLSIPGKLFTRILLTRALPAIRSRRRPQQAGFMPSRSTTDHISALRLIIEKAREFRKDRSLYIAFIDLKAAFDTIDHCSLWKILKGLGAPTKIVSLFRNLYGTAESCVRVNGNDSTFFPINSGVH